VTRLKVASPAFASNDVASLALHVIATSLACQRPSDAPQDTLGLVTSRLIVTDLLLVPPPLVALQVKIVPVVSAVT